MNARPSMGAFLRSRRERLAPAEVGGRPHIRRSRREAVTMTDKLEEVRFLSGDILFAGHIRRPNDKRQPYSALMFTGPFIGVKEQVTGTYAAALALRGHLTPAEAYPPSIERFAEEIVGLAA